MYLNLTIENGQTKSLAIDGASNNWLRAIAVRADASSIMLQLVDRRDLAVDKQISKRSGVLWVIIPILIRVSRSLRDIW